ncbi:hypothetical protein WK26_08485 [Burkholderia vietnamiensis]|nr:hypothetical protein WK26_08485 [Burkholderia vietnamiensis]
MRNSTRIMLTLTITFWIQAVHADPLTDAYAAATTNDKLVFCAPVLVKEGGMFEVMATRMVDKGDTDNAEKDRHAAFNIGYRGETLQMLAKSTNPSLLDQAWKISADNIAQSSYSALTQSCVALYNEQREAGVIPENVETQAVEKVRRAMGGQAKKTAVAPECRSKGSSNIDLCAQARAYADYTAKMLPMQISRNLTITTIFAIGKRITMTAELAYDRQYLESLAASKGVSMQSIDSAMNKTAENNVCTHEAVKAFIDSGGTVQYAYRFRDGTNYLNPVVSSCH